MYITVKQLANKVNNLERFSREELNNDKIKKIIVTITNNGTHIDYYVISGSGKKERYTEDTIPHSIIYLMNRNKAAKHEKTVLNETFTYILD